MDKTMKPSKLLFFKWFIKKVENEEIAQRKKGVK
jgi:hypothetical protein